MPSRRAGPIRAGCGPTAPSSAGAGTATAKRRRPVGHSSRSRPAASTLADCGPTTPSNAGAEHYPTDKFGPEPEPEQEPEPERPNPLNPAVDGGGFISGGDHFTCGLRTNSTVTCWGSNTHGQTVVPDGEFTAVTAGSVHACGLRADGTVECWGGNDRGQANPPEGRYTAVAAGGDHTCGMGTDGTVTCWGWNYHRQTNPPDGQFITVTAGRTHNCAMRTDGTVTCWGWNHNGQTDPPDGQVHHCRCRLIPQLRAADRQRPSCAGAGTPTVKPTRPEDASPPSRPASTSAAGCEPTAPSNAGDTHATSSLVLPAGDSWQLTAGASHYCGLLNRWSHSMLGRLRLRPGRPADRRVHRRLGGHLPQLRAANRRHRRMLGRSSRQGRDRASGRSIHRCVRLPRLQLRAANRRHRRMLGPQRVRTECCSRWAVRRRFYRLAPYVRAHNRQYRRMLEHR